ncbi:hypothetical protein ACHAXS_011769 [Conticribra weissflogii]
MPRSSLSSSSSPWWSSIPEECPITLEPLRDLPYPPFILTSPRDTHPAKKYYYFDGLALATYMVSQGNFSNPLTREPLGYDDCLRLDCYLTEHIYLHRHGAKNNSPPSKEGSGSENNINALSHPILGNNGKISVSEAFSLRDSIKVKTSGNSDEARRRAEVLRNEAAAALRGLFVFGHGGDSPSLRGGLGLVDSRGSDDGVGGNSRYLQSLPRSEGGFNLQHVPDSSLHHSWGMSSTYEQLGLRLIDDDEAAFEAADLDAWREVQEAFPYLSCRDGGRNNDMILAPTRPFDSTTVANNGDANNSLLESVRQTAQLTHVQETEEAARLARQRQLYFVQALERKRNRILERKRAKEAAKDDLMNKKHEEEELQSAREEIERWRAKQWEDWERAALKYESKRKEKEERRRIENDQPVEKTTAATTNNAEKISQEPRPDEGELATEQQQQQQQKAAAKKALKRQKAKERAKEKKRLERIEQDKRERELALQREKGKSSLKCGACGDGILDCGFEKFGVRFCTAKCARNGPSGVSKT